MRSWLLSSALTIASRASRSSTGASSRRRRRGSWCSRSACRRCSVPSFVPTDRVLLGVPGKPSAQPPGGSRLSAHQGGRGGCVQAVRVSACCTGGTVRSDRIGGRQVARSGRESADARTHARDECRLVHEFAAPGHAAATVPFLRRQGVVPADRPPKPLSLNASPRPTSTVVARAP